MRMGTASWMAATAARMALWSRADMTPRPAVTREKREAPAAAACSAAATNSSLGSRG